MPNLCLHVMPAHTAPSWLLIEKLLQHSQDRTSCELHTKQSDNRGGGVICQYVLKVGTRTLQLPGMWETLFTGSYPQEVHNSDVFIVLDYRDFHFWLCPCSLCCKQLVLPGYDKKFWHTAAHFTAEKKTWDHDCL